MKKTDSVSQKLISKGHKTTKKWKTLAGIMAIIVTFTTTYSLILPAITVSREQVDEIAGLYLDDSEEAFDIVEDNEDGEELYLPEAAVAQQADGIDDSWDDVLIEEETEEESEANVDVLETVPDENAHSADEIITESVAAEAVTEKEIETETEEGTETEVETDTEKESETVGEETETDAETEAETETEAEAETETETASGTETELQTETETETRFPAQRFTASEDGVLIIVNAPESAFPEGTTMTVSHVDDEQTLKGIEEAAQTDEKHISRIEAVDICFRDADGNEIEPKAPVSVCMITENKASKEDPVVVHVDDDGHTETVQDAEVYTTGTHDQIVLTANGSAANQAEPETETIDESSADAAAKTTIEFETEQFSIYAVVYTVDFHWEVDGKTYEYSIEGGDSISFRELAELLNVIPAADETGSWPAAYAGGTLDDFIGNIEDIQFSRPELVWTGKLSQDASVSEIIDNNGLEVVYPADMTDEEKAEILTKAYSAGEWILVSVKPFNTEESLTVTMKNGESFVIRVTDAQITARYLAADGTSYDITVIYEKDAQIPDDARLDVREILPGTAEYADYLMRSAQQLGEGGTESISYARFFDIKILDEAAEIIEPAAPVLVTIEYADGAVIEAAKDLHVVHFANSGTEVLEGIGVNQEGTVMTYLQNGFSVTGTIVSNPAANDQYMVLIEYDNKYYIVNNDGSLTKVSDTAGSTVEVDEPMMWTYDGQNIYHHSEQTSFNNSQLAADFFNKYIDPTDPEDGISTENRDNTPLRDVNEQYFDWNTWTMQTFTYQVTNGRPLKNYTRLTLSGDKIQSAVNSGQYLGVVEEDGVLKLVGGADAGHAATVHLAQAGQVLKTNYLNHVVNHIDISIEGEAEADIPLAYGKYYDANGNMILDVQENRNLHLTSGVVGINMDDMKRAVITAYTKDQNGTTTELDNAFVVNGYSANESTEYSTQQVRIEGDFRVANIPPVTQQYYNSHTQRVWQDRLANKIYYSVTAYKTVEFDLIDPEYGQLYDSEGNKMTVKVDVALSASFDYWDTRNECPPVRWDNTWQSGNIPDHNLSGMDFVLGGNPEGNAKIHAVEIKKVIVDENGNRISPKQAIHQSFNIYYNPDSVDASTNGEGTLSNLRNQDTIKNKDSNAYAAYDPSAQNSGFHYQHQKTLRVGEDGVGQLYDYDVSEGVFYISEDTDDVQEEIVDTSNKTWYYDSTYIETEYVWRNNSSYDGSVHKSDTYKDLANDSYISRAEVLGRYKNYNNGSENLDNQFLEFTVYNVYRSSLVETKDVDVTKNWTTDKEDETVEEVYLKLYRRADDSTEEDFTSAIQAEVQANASNAYQYFKNADDFDAQNGWIVVKKGTDAWKTVQVKNLPTKTSAEENAPAYTYYFREVGYKDADGQVYGNADAYNPEYTYTVGSGTETNVPQNGIALADNMHFTVTNTKTITNTSYTVKKSFADGYPTDGSVQVLVTLEKGYLQENGTKPSNWTDAGVSVVSLPLPKPENSDLTDEAWYGSEDAWTYTWEEIPAVQKVNGIEEQLWYRAKEISADWFGTPVITPADGQKVVPLEEDGSNQAEVDNQKAIIENKPAADTLTVNKKWVVDGENESWPNGAEATVQVVQYWHLAEVDASANPAAMTIGDVFLTENMEGADYTHTLKNGSPYTFEGLPSYAYMEPTDAQIVEAKKNGITLESGRKYLVVFTYGAKETQVKLDGQEITMDLTVPGEQDGKAFTSNITNELTDLTVKKEWHKSGAASADTAWPEGVEEIKYSIMRVPVYTMEDRRTVEFDAEIYKDDEETTALTENNFAVGVTYENLPLQGVVTVAYNEQGMVNGTYPVRYRYYVVESASETPFANGLSTTEMMADSVDGTATLVNEYTSIKVEKKWQKVNESGQDEAIPFPEGFKVNWKVVQEASDGTVVDPYYTAYTTPAQGETEDRDYRLTKAKDNHELKYLPARGVNAAGEPVTYTYKVYELPEGSVAPEDNPYPFQMIKAVAGSGENAGTYTITNDLTQVTVKKVWSDSAPTDGSVTVQLYATVEKPSDLETVDVKVTLDEWGTNRTALTEGQVTGKLEGTDGSSREFTLTPGNDWTRIFAGLPKYDNDGHEITYSVSITNGPAEGNTAQLHSTIKDENAITIKLQAEGIQKTVSFKFNKGTGWPESGNLQVHISITNGSGAEVWSRDLFCTESEEYTGNLPSDRYTITYSLKNGANYSIISESPIISDNETGAKEYDIDLKDNRPRFVFNAAGTWPSNLSDGQNVWIQVYKVVQGTNWWDSSNYVWGGNLASASDTTSSSPLEPGTTYHIQYAMQDSFPSGYQLAAPDGGTVGGNGFAHLETTINNSDITVPVTLIEKTGPAEGEVAVNFGLITRAADYSVIASPSRGFITVKVTNNDDANDIQYVTLSPADWAKTIYIQERKDQWNYTTYKVEVDDFDRSVFKEAVLEQGFIGRYNTLEPRINAKLEDGYVDSQSASSSKAPVRTLMKAPVLRANAAHPDVTVTAPTETIPGTEGKHDITVIDKSNLPEGAEAIGEEVILNNSNTPSAWQHTWENLPKYDADGNRIYYYAVEKKATTDVNGVTSATATYVIEEDENTGAFTVNITNTTTTETPKTGTIMVEKKLTGVSAEKEFKFYLQRASTGQYLTVNGTWSDSEVLLSIWPGQTYTFTNLPLGNYVLKEDTSNTAITGYIFAEAGSTTGTAGSGISVIADGTSEFTFNNVYTPEPIRVEKAWKNADGSTTVPEGATVQFQLYRNNEAVGGPVVLDGTADANGEVEAWVAEWTDLPRYPGNDTAQTPYVYTVKEVVDENGYSWQHYKATYNGDAGITIGAEGNRITNEEDKTSINVTKQWKDEQGREVTNKGPIAFTLYQTYTDGTGAKYSSVYTSATQRAGTETTAAPLEDGRGEVKYEANSWQTIVIENLPKKVRGEDGAWHDAAYYVVEDGIANVTATYLLDSSGSENPESVATNGGNTITIDNRNDSTSLTVEKNWDDLAEDTPYTIDFIVQWREKDTDDWQDLKESDDEDAAVKNYRLTFNGATYSIQNKKTGSEETYSSNVIINLPAGKQYRVVETAYTTGDGSSQIEVTFASDKQIEGTSETADNGKTWTSKLENTLEKIQIEGRKIWKDDKNHTDPTLILKRKAGEGDWEILTASKNDPTLFVETTEDPKTSANYTYLQPIWQTRERVRWYVYKNLPKYDPQGKEYTYQVEEKPVPGFEPIYGTPEAGAFGCDITNTPVGDLQVRKVWFAGAKDDEKATITYKIEWSTDKSTWNPLKADTEDGTWILAEAETEPEIHTLTNADDWKAVFRNLPRLNEVTSAGVTTYLPIYYRVVELKVGKTDVNYPDGDSSREGTAGVWTVVNAAPIDLDDDSTVELTMTNNKPLISISGKKTWVTVKEDDELPALTLKLISWTDPETEGGGVTETTWQVVASAGGIGNYQYVILPEEGGNPLVDDAVTPRFKWYKNGKVWNYAFTYLPKFDPVSQKPLRYRVEEEMPEEGAENFSQETTPGQVTERGDITNWDFVNTEETSIKVIKHWLTNDQPTDGDPFEPDRKVQVELYRRGDNVETLGIYEIEKNNDAEEGEEKWQLVIPNLPKYYRDANGDLHDYSYYVVERDTGIWHVEYSSDNQNYTIAANRVSAQDEDNPIYLQNSAWTVELPSTGGPGSNLLYLLGSLLLAFSGAGLVMRKRRWAR